jgi:molybdenum cofactor cytidylyltransferase
VRSVGVLLAAGLGQRFDPTRPGAKLVARFDDESVGGRSLLSLVSVVDATIIVVRSLDTELAKQAYGLGARVVVPTDHEPGMGHSIAAAASAAIAEFTAAETLLLALADMPWVLPQTHQIIAQNCTADAIARPRFDGTPGHPVAFGRTFWLALSRCTGDHGARSVIAEHASLVRYVDVKDAGVLRDIDLPIDLPGSQAK